jgi:RHS repeat-associated protein
LRRGSVAERTDSIGAVLTSYAFDAYGLPLPTGTAWSDPYAGFGGQWGGYADSESGLSLFGHRYYDSGTGRWVTRDPIGYAGGLDLYAYCDGDPVNNIDPSGHFLLPLILIGVFLYAETAADPPQPGYTGHNIGDRYVNAVGSVLDRVMDPTATPLLTDPKEEAGISGGPYYRGGPDMTVKPKEYHLDKNGLLNDTHGLSVNRDPDGLDKFGGAHEVKDLPPGLKIIQRGGNKNHFEIVPEEPGKLTPEEFQALLRKVPLSKILPIVEDLK